MSLTVVFVCTGNICRSPMAERLLLARAEPGSLTVASAGTYGLTGHEMDAQAALVTRELGADPSGHAAREITAAMMQGADLVLGATQEHRDRVLRLAPRALRRTFTLREFTRLGSSLPPAPTVPTSQGTPDDQALRSRIADIAGRRGLADPPAAGADDIGDPYGGTLEGMRACGSVISAQIDDLVALLGIPRSTQS